MTIERELACKEVVELVTAYLEQRLPPAEAARLDAHLAACDGCTTYVEQMRQTIAAAGALRGDELPPGLADRLLDAFRGWRSTGE